MIVAFGGKTPKYEKAAYLSETAVLEGDVTLCADTSIWYGAVLRGDDGPITVGRGSNVQDNAVLHCDPGGAVTIGEDVTVGHSAIVHGCTVGDGTLIGMHATLLNHCKIGKGCIIGAGALVPEGMEVPDGMLVVGIPAKILKPARPEQIAHALENSRHYVKLGAAHAEAQAAAKKPGAAKAEFKAL